MLLWQQANQSIPDVPINNYQLLLRDLQPLQHLASIANRRSRLNGLLALSVLVIKGSNIVGETSEQKQRNYDSGLTVSNVPDS